IPVLFSRHPGKGEYNPFPGNRKWKALTKAALELLLLPGERYKGVLRVLRPPHGIYTPDRYYELVGEEGKPRRFVLGEFASASVAVEAREIPQYMNQLKVSQAAEFIRRTVKPGDGALIEDLREDGKHLVS